ncbi:MAG: response regulator [bacterium]|nr:response regulator [bacterium]
MADPKPYVALIVEDTEDVAGMMEVILQSIGLETNRARNGFEALSHLEAQTPDIMILDIGMPGMSGWDVLETLKAQNYAFPFPIIVMTAYSDPANKLIGKLQDAVYRYMTKPFEAAALAQTVREALGMN